MNIHFDGLESYLIFALSKTMWFKALDWPWTKTHIPRERTPDNQYTDAWVGLRASLKAAATRLSFVLFTLLCNLLHSQTETFL
jgi:hypothetical protein